jgi:hypothetical protein
MIQRRAGSALCTWTCSTSSGKRARSSAGSSRSVGGRGGVGAAGDGVVAAIGARSGSGAGAKRDGASAIGAGVTSTGVPWNTGVMSSSEPASLAGNSRSASMTAGVDAGGDGGGTATACSVTVAGCGAACWVGADAAGAAPDGRSISAAMPTPARNSVRPASAIVVGRMRGACGVWLPPAPDSPI